MRPRGPLLLAAFMPAEGVSPVVTGTIARSGRRLLRASTNGRSARAESRPPRETGDRKRKRAGMTVVKPAIVAWLLWLGLAGGAALAHETTAPERPADEAAQSRLSVVLDASGALSLQLEGPDSPPPGPWRTDRDSLAEDIRERLQFAESPQVHFRGSPDAAYGMVVDILARLSDAGYRPRIVIERRR